MVDVGDVIVTTVAKSSCPLRLVLLDCGITASLGKDDRAKFTQVFTAIVKGQVTPLLSSFLILSSLLGSVMNPNERPP